MIKVNTKSFIVAILSLVFLVGIANAQDALPTGGDDFETAVELELGSYEGGAMESGEAEYFYINMEPGRELQIEGIIKTPTDSVGEGYIYLYDEDREKLAEAYAILEEGEQEPFSFSWLPNADKDLYKYYIKRECTWVKIASHSLDISLTDHYDAGSQTDAGDTFDKAMSIASGEHEACLSGESGTDTNDFYNMTVEKGETLTVKVTPPSGATMRVTIYDSNRAVLKDEYASNAGAIVTNSVLMAKSGEVFIAAVCDKWCSEDIVAYTMDVSIEEAPVEEEEDVPIGVGEDEELGEEAGAPVGPNWALIIIVIVIIIAVIGIVAYFLLKKKK